MIEVISKPFYSEFINACKNSRTNIKLCAPFVKKDIIADIINIKRKEIALSLITKIDLKSFHNQVSDIDALKQTLSAKGRVYNCSNLHAKIYIFDDRFCFITSANLTALGLMQNEECGIYTDETNIVENAVSTYTRIKKRDDVGRILVKNIDEITSLLSKIPLIPKTTYPTLVLPKNGSEDLQKIANGLQGWKRSVFLALGEFSDIITSHDVGNMAEMLKSKYPSNNYREAKIRQVLQQLRDIGLVEFVSPGIYKKLWI